MLAPGRQPNSVDVMSSCRLALPLCASMLALAACATPEPAVQEEQFTRIQDEPEEVPSQSEAPPTVTQTVTEKQAPNAPAKTYDGIVPRTSPDNENSGYSMEKRDFLGSGSNLTIMELRAGVHDGFDRVVFEFTGSGYPGFSTEWVDDPIPYGSDFPVGVGGNAFLHLWIRDTINDSGNSYSHGASAGYVKDIWHTAAHKIIDKTEYFIGLDRQRPYRIFYLDNPTRLVIDFES